ncbi:MAG: InlB B-repeat-containing protein [bacterium]|nr:InlB B-repeat-containing protein [bacterium]
MRKHLSKIHAIVRHRIHRFGHTATRKQSHAAGLITSYFHVHKKSLASGAVTALLFVAFFGMVGTYILDHNAKRGVYVAELAFSDLSPKGEVGGRILPASCEAGYTHALPDSCADLFTFWVGGSNFPYYTDPATGAWLTRTDGATSMTIPYGGNVDIHWFVPTGYPFDDLGGGIFSNRGHDFRFSADWFFAPESAIVQSCIASGGWGGERYTESNVALPMGTQYAWASNCLSGCTSVGTPRFVARQEDWNTGPLTSSQTYTVTCSVFYADGLTGTASKSVTVNVAASGSFDPRPTDCIIPAGASSCTTSFSWNVNNPTISLVYNNGVKIYGGPSGSGTGNVIFGQNTTTFQLYDGATLLDTQVVSGTCVANTTWNGSICAWNSYTYTFNGNGATVGPVPSSVYQVYDSPISAPSNPSLTGYTFTGWSPAIPATMPLGGGISNAQWAVNTYPIDVTVSGPGTIPPGSINAPAGSNQTFTITPNTGNSITSVLVDGVNQGVIGSYTFTNVQGPHSISATFNTICFNGYDAAGNPFTRTLDSSYDRVPTEPSWTYRVTRYSPTRCFGNSGTTKYLVPLNTQAEFEAFWAAIPRLTGLYTIP